MDIAPLLDYTDHPTSAPFALALVEGFFNSDQAASDRWALTLGGLLGDNRIIPPLLYRIQDWCENSRHKLAEYAAQAISLLPGNEPLMVLDTLSNRYRSRFDPESGKSWKSLPATAPDAVKTEVKTLTKLLRETVKGQTARLEMTLVRQRRWPVTRWRELYENHPLLRSFASPLVWGVYDHSGTLLRTFRRYPNGLLADATGNLDELPPLNFRHHFDIT